LLQLLVAAAQALISAYEAEQLVQQLRVMEIEQVRSIDSVNDEDWPWHAQRDLDWCCCCICQVGDAKFTKQHDAIQKLNMQVGTHMYNTLILHHASLKASQNTADMTLSAATHGFTTTPADKPALLTVVANPRFPLWHATSHCITCDNSNVA
jgi:hypothetical protein